MKQHLALVPICDERQAPPAAMHELAASRYVGMNRSSFRALVFSGVIPFTCHLNGVRRIYLRADLDAYLGGLPRRRMAPRENSPKPTLLKGAGNK